MPSPYQPTTYAASRRRSSSIFVVQDDVTCGVACFRPRWLQDFANTEAFAFVLCLAGIVQSAFAAYLVGASSTLEKRFGFGSSASGKVLVADVFVPVLMGLPVYKYASSRKVHRSRLIASGMLMAVLSCFLAASLHFMPGREEIFLASDGSSRRSGSEYCGSDSSNGKACLPGDYHHSKAALGILLLANFLNGFGHLAFYAVGIPHLSDVLLQKSSASFFCAMSALRVFGPVLGFLLSSFCLKFYEDPFYDPGIDAHNPRWVGAWWMGFLILGVILLFLSLLLILFPRQLPERFRSEIKKEDKEEKQKSLPKLKEFPQAAKRLLRNPILVCHVVGVTFQVNGFVGYFVFMPKFMEAQYQQSASDASLFSGVTGILSLLLGILLGGMVIMKYKPRPRYLTGYMVFVEILSVVGLFISMFLGCDPIQMPGTTPDEGSTLDLYNDCNGGCGCTRRVFEPVCGEDGLSTYFSPCFAGCPNLTGVATSAVISALSNGNSSAQLLESCKCTGGWNSTFTTSTVTSGFCKSTCNMFLVYIILLCISKFISATARVGNTLITFRCVEAKDKSFALGVFGSVLALFAFIPYPLIYGALTDSACLVWEQSCGRTGNCWLYDSDKFRNYLHGMSMLLISIGICFDGVVFLLSDRLTGFYGDEHQAAAGGATWLKEDEDEDVIFTRFPKRGSVVEVDPVL